MGRQIAAMAVVAVAALIVAGWAMIVARGSVTNLRRCPACGETVRARVGVCSACNAGIGRW
jgi:hypothetical protein